MLPQAHPLTRLALVVSAALLSLSAHAQTSPEPAFQMPPGFGTAPTDEQVKEGVATGQEVVRRMLETYESRKNEETFVKPAQASREFADSIADEAMQASRDEVLEFLGIDPKGSSAAYVFVSYSMPLPLLRAYAIEAMWSGATLVVRGVPPGKELGEFITKDLRQLVYGKGAAANISLDPRLFDAYGIQTVPTMVLTSVREDIQCQGAGDVSVALDDGGTSRYSRCPALDEKSYWKMSGGVSLGYALQAFKDAGAEIATPHLQALSRGLAQGGTPVKAQVPFNGVWEDVLSPTAQKAAMDAAQSMTTLRPVPSN